MIGVRWNIDPSPFYRNCTIAPCEKVHLCRTVSEAIEQFKFFGFTLLAPDMVMLDDGDIVKLQDAVSSVEPRAFRRGADGECSKLRYSINSMWHIHDERWRSVGVKVLDEDSAVAKTIDRIAELSDPSRKWAFHSF